MTINSETKRATVETHYAHSNSLTATIAHQIVQLGGKSNDAIAPSLLNFASADISQPAAHYYPRQASHAQRHDPDEQIFSEPWKGDQFSMRDFIKCAASENPARVQTDSQPKRARADARVCENPTNEK